MPSITLDDGKKINYKKPITGEEIAKSISPSLSKKALVIKVDNDFKDLSTIIEKDAKIKLEESLERKKKLLDQKLKRAEVEALSAIKDEVSEVIFEAINKSITSNNIKPSSYDKILQDGIKQIRK